MKYAIAIVVATIIVAVAIYWQCVSEDGLPPRTECMSQSDAAKQAVVWEQKHGGIVVSIYGTGSMAPYIPAAPKGDDPRSTVVAIVVVDTRSYDLVKQGDLCVYRAEWSPGMPVVHVAVDQTMSGWIMSGLNNQRYEATWRMDSSNFIGRVTIVYIWPLK